MQDPNLQSSLYKPILKVSFASTSLILLLCNPAWVVHRAITLSTNYEKKTFKEVASSQLGETKYSLIDGN